MRKKGSSPPSSFQRKGDSKGSGKPMKPMTLGEGAEEADEKKPPGHKKGMTQKGSTPGVKKGRMC